MNVTNVNSISLCCCCDESDHKGANKRQSEKGFDPYDSNTGDWIYHVIEVGNAEDRVWEKGGEKNVD